MKQIKVSIVMLICVTLAYAFSSGPPPGVTGAPGDESRACTRCHPGSLNPDARGQITISGAPANYTPGQRYTLTVAVTHPDTDRRRWGFQLTALTQNDNQPAGNLEITNPAQTQRVIGGPGGNRQYVEHTSAGTGRGRTGGMSWSFDWIAPRQNVGPVVFYAAGNAANNNGTALGDRIYTASVVSNASVLFQDVAAAAGLVNAGGGNGIAWGDYNSDGAPDLYVAREGQDLLFRNNGNGTFAEVARTLRLVEDAQGQAAAWFDYDGDRDLDLFVVNRGQSRLYRNDSQAGFTDVSPLAGLQDGIAGYAVAIADYDRDGDLDVFQANGGPDILYCNNGDGTFTDIADLLGLADDRVSLGAAWGDFNGDGALDLFVANVGPDFLYIGNPTSPGLGFVDVAAAARVADSATSFTGAWADYDRDGRLDLFVANEGTDFLYRNRGDGTFENVTGTAGITGQGVSRSAAWADFDRDGDLDLFVVNADGPDFLYRNEGNGRFREVAAILGIADNAPGGAAAWEDFDRDGDLDIAIANGSSFSLYRNPGF
jgi:hypothetical protein